MTVTAQPTVTAERESELLASVPTGLLINGEWRPAASGKTFDVEDPATGKVLLSIADAGPEDGKAALDAAAAAQGVRPGIIVVQNWFEELKARVPVSR